MQKNRGEEIKREVFEEQARETEAVEMGRWGGQVRSMRQLRREPHATCFDGISNIRYNDKPPDFMSEVRGKTPKTLL